MPPQQNAMFQITRRADYAVRLMLDLGDLPAGEWKQASRVARSTGIPQPFLHKITPALASAGLVQTRPGPTGGLALAAPAASINLLCILEAVEGPIRLNVCLVRPGECPRDEICPGHTFWGRLQAMVAEELRQATLDKLVAEARALKRRPRRRERPALIPLPVWNT